MVMKFLLNSLEMSKLTKVKMLAKEKMLAKIFMLAKKMKMLAKKMKMLAKKMKMLAKKEEDEAGQEENVGQEEDAGQEDEEAGQEEDEEAAQEEDAGQETDAGQDEDEAGQDGDEAGQEEDEVGQENEVGQEEDEAGQENEAGQEADAAQEAGAGKRRRRTSNKRKKATTKAKKGTYEKATGDAAATTEASTALAVIPTSGTSTALAVIPRQSSSAAASATASIATAVVQSKKASAKEKKEAAAKEKKEAGAKEKREAAAKEKREAAAKEKKEATAKEKKEAATKAKKEADEKAASEAAAKATTNKRKKNKATGDEDKEAATSKARKVASTAEAPPTPPLNNPALEDEKRDRIKSAKLKSLWHLLPAGLKDIVDNLGRDEKTKFINSAFDEKPKGKKRQLVLNHAVVEETMERAKELKNKMSNKGYIKHEAAAKLGGMAQLQDALQEGSVIKYPIDGYEMYFFPQVDFSKEESLKFGVKGSKDKAVKNSEWQLAMDSGLGFVPGQLETDDGPGHASSSMVGLQLNLPALEEHRPAEIDDDFLKEMSTIHNSMAKSSQSAILLMDKFKSEKLPKMNKSMLSIANDLLAKLDTTLVDCEHCLTKLNLALKLKKLAGGYTVENLTLLKHEATDILENMNFAMKTLKGM